MGLESDAPKRNLVETIKEGATSQEGNNQAPPVLSPKSNIPPPVTNPTETKKDREYRLNRNRFWVEILTLVAVVAYALIAYQQWEEMRKSTEAATKAAQIAEATLKSTKDSFERDQRAWIIVEKLLLEDEPRIGQKITVHGRFQNTGKTPARKETLFWGIDIRSSAPPTEIIYSKIYKPIRVVIPSGPLRSLSISTEQTVTQELLDSINKKKLVLYVYGLIEYKDTFDQQLRTTEFCGFYNPDRRTEGDFGLQACADHNEIR